MRSNRGVTGIELLAILAIATLFTTMAVSINGCSTTQTGTSRSETLVVAERIGLQIVASRIGNYVAKKKPAADPIIRNAYALAVDGKLSAELITEAVEAVGKDDELLASDCAIVLEALGAELSPEGKVLSLANIRPEMWSAAKAGYLRGFAIGAAKKG